MTSGQCLIDSESRLREAMHKMLEPGSGADDEATGPETKAEPDHSGHAMPHTEP